MCRSPDVVRRPPAAPPAIGVQARFVYYKTMPAKDHVDIEAAGIAAMIAEPARARMLYCLLDGQARTSTELAVVGEVGASTASVHLAKMARQRLVTVLSQ